MVAHHLNLELETNSTAGFAATTKGEVKSRIQIKGRRLTEQNQSRQLSVIRKYEEKDFDELVAVIFNEDFTVKEAYRMPHEVIGKYAKYRPHPNGHVVILKGPILEDDRVVDITGKFRV